MAFVLGRPYKRVAGKAPLRLFACDFASGKGRLLRDDIPKGDALVICAELHRHAARLPRGIYPPHARREYRSLCLLKLDPQFVISVAHCLLA